MDHILNNKNVLVTGGAGLVGAHVVEKLLNLGAKVWVLDILVNPHSYFETQKLTEQCEVVIQDVRDLPKLRKLVVENQISYIFHLAAQALVPLAFREPLLTLDTNIMGTINVLEVAREKSSLLGVVVASSDKAYGKNCQDATENQPLSGDHPYDVSKSAADLICTAYYNTYKVPVTVSRFANIFGPGDLNFDRLVPGAIKSILTGETLLIRSDGKFVRDYLYVKDVADGYVLLAEKIDEVKGQAFNFSAGYNLTVLELVNQIEQALGKTLRYEIVNNQQNEIPFQSLNFEKVTAELEWKAKYGLADAIRETHKWYNDIGSLQHL